MRLGKPRLTARLAVRGISPAKSVGVANGLNGGHCGILAPLASSPDLSLLTRNLILVRVAAYRSGF